MASVDPVVWLDPEIGAAEAELRQLGQELAAVESQLVEARTRLAAFSHIHDRLLAPWYARLDEIEAQIAELLAEGSTSLDDLIAATTARDRARESAAAAQTLLDDPTEPPPVPPPPSSTLRGLYRSLAKLCHPDLAVDEPDRRRREAFMTRVNDAYARQDIDALRHLAEEWETIQATEVPTGVGGRERLAQLRTAVAAARERIAAMRRELARLTGTGLGRLLFGQADAMAALDRLVAHLRERIDQRRAFLTELRDRRR
jgi:hypothetical protein